MSMSRMYHVACDAAGLEFGCRGKNDPGDEWYATAALERAREAGFHIRAEKAICAECWEAGYRYISVEGI